MRGVKHTAALTSSSLQRLRSGFQAILLPHVSVVMSPDESKILVLRRSSRLVEEFLEVETRERTPLLQPHGQQKDVNERRAHVADKVGLASLAEWQGNSGACKIKHAITPHLPNSPPPHLPNSPPPQLPNSPTPHLPNSSPPHLPTSSVCVDAQDSIQNVIIRHEKSNQSFHTEMENYNLILSSSQTPNTASLPTNKEQIPYFHCLGPNINPSVTSKTNLSVWTCHFQHVQSSENEACQWNIDSGGPQLIYRGHAGH